MARGKCRSIGKTSILRRARSRLTHNCSNKQGKKDNILVWITLRNVGGEFMIFIATDSLQGESVEGWREDDRENEKSSSLRGFDHEAKDGKHNGQKSSDHSC